MTKQIHSIAIAARLLPFGMVLLIGMQTAQARECSAALPSHPQGHWSYRLIDGRKCWYEGENGLSKSLLQWAVDAPPSPENDPLSLSPPHSPQATPPAPQPKSSTAGASSVPPPPTSGKRVSEEAPIRILTTKPIN